MESNHNCPTCGETFTSRRGVINHHNSHARPYFDAEIEEKYGVPAGWLLHTLYQIIGDSTRDIASKLGYSKPVINKHLKRHGIDLRKSNRDKPVHFSTYRNTNGFAYERWEHNMATGNEKVYHHRLLAVAKYGIDAVTDMNVHHKNEIPWDNRMENITLIPHDEHRRKHALSANELND